MVEKRVSVPIHFEYTWPNWFFIFYFKKNVMTSTLLPRATWGWSLLTPYYFVLWRPTQRNRLIPYTDLLALLVNWRPLLITCKDALSFSLFIYEAILIGHGSYGFLSFGLECCTYKCKLIGTTFNVITPGNY